MPAPTQAHKLIVDAYWAMLEASETWKALVKPNNRLKNDDRRVDEKESLKDSISGTPNFRISLSSSTELDGPVTFGYGSALAELDYAIRTRIVVDIRGVFMLDHDARLEPLRAETTAILTFAPQWMYTHSLKWTGQIKCSYTRRKGRVPEQGNFFGTVLNWSMSHDARPLRSILVPGG